MFRVEEYHGDANLLRPITVSWIEESQGSQFGLVIEADHQIADLQRIIDSPDCALLILVLNDESVVGYIGLDTFKSPLSSQKIANEHYWYVLPEKRGKGSLKLIDAAEEWAKSNGCSHLIMNASNLASGLHDKVCKLYERKGFSLFETSHIKEI